MLLDEEPIFNRVALARYFVEFLKSPESASGLFLAAPRRTGKTTFIKQDLFPLLRAEGATVIYADLWEQKDVNPASVISQAIRSAILQREGTVLKAAKSTGLTRFKLAGFELDLDKIGAKDGDSLSKSLQALAAATGQPIIMVIDEAQHAQTTFEGRQALFALKAARDAMKGGGGPGFRLLATGSNSDKLATLVGAKDQAFFLAPMESLEPLGADYLQWVLDTSTASQKPSLQALVAGFEMCSHRPEPLKQVLRALTRPTSSNVDVDARFLELMRLSLDAARQNFMQSVHGMGRLDVAVLAHMARARKDFRPFEPATLQAYRQFMTDAGDASAELPSTSAVQSALARLRREGLVWNAGRGAWTIEDNQHAAWILNEAT